MLDTSSESLFSLLYNLSLWITAIILLLFCYLMILRISHSRRQAHYARFINYWKPRLFGVIANDNSHKPIPKFATLDNLANKLWFAELWSQLHCCVSGSGDDNLDTFAKQHNLHEVFASLLQQDSVRIRISALIALADLADIPPTTIQYIDNNLDSKNAMLALARVRFISRHHPERLLATLIKQIGIVAPQRLVSVLRVHVYEHASALSLLKKVTAFLETADSKKCIFLLKIIEGLELTIGNEVLKQIFQQHQDNSELLACCLSHVQTPDFTRTIIDCLSHKHEGVRVQATLALGRLATNQELPLLWQQLHDKSWWVRYRAAQALVAHPGVSSAFLQEKVQALSDDFAKDVLVHAMSESQHEQLAHVG